MGIRPAKCYTKLERPYTRQSRRRPRKGYVKGVPEMKIHRFEEGTRKPEFSMEFNLVIEEDVQIRDNSLESIRVSTGKSITKRIGEGNFFLKILVYPHHVIRENAMSTGAGADRFQSGMRQSFGRPAGSAARIMKGQSIMQILARPQDEMAVKKAIKTTFPKVPANCKIVVSKV
jgi:large subunit ribosomal protein L10e